MKRFLVLSILIASLLPVFSTGASSIELEGGQTGTSHFQINGYYDRNPSSTYQFKVWVGEDDTNRIYHSGNIVMDNPDVSQKIEVFRWSLSWSSGSNLTLTFTFMPLQAYSDGMYFIPKHSFTLESDDYADKVISFGAVGSGNFPYPGYGNAKDRIKSNGYSLSGLDDTGLISGECYLKIERGLDTETAGTMVYQTTVVVEFCVQ